jgi:hypothetical protein
VGKRTTTRWYIGAWLAWCLAFLSLIAMARMTGPTSMPPPGSFIAYLVMFLAMVVTFVAWLGALLRLGHLRAWSWFIAVLVLHLIGLGIIGMVAYAIAGPEDREQIVYRPTVT